MPSFDPRVLDTCPMHGPTEMCLIWWCWFFQGRNEYYTYMVLKNIGMCENDVSFQGGIPVSFLEGNLFLGWALIEGMPQVDILRSTSWAESPYFFCQGCIYKSQLVQQPDLGTINSMCSKTLFSQGMNIVLVLNSRRQGTDTSTQIIQAGEFLILSLLQNILLMVQKSQTTWDV